MENYTKEQTHNLQPVDFAHTQTSAFSTHVPVILIALVNALADKIGVNQTAIMRGGLILLLNSIRLDVNEGTVYAPVETIDALLKGSAISTAFPENMEHLVTELFPEK